MPRVRATLVAALALLAGCLGAGPGPGPDAPAPDLRDVLVVEHDHMDLAEHAVAVNVTLAAWDGLAPKGTPSGAHAVDLRGNLLVVAMASVAGEGDRGFALFDVSAPESPRLLSKYVDARAAGGDRMVMLSADGKAVFLGAESPNQDGLVLAVDISDPTAPTLADEALVPPFGPHTVFAAEVGGVQYVYAVSFGLHVFRWEGGELTLAGRYATATPGQLLQMPDGPEAQGTYAFRDLYGHDVFAWEDPVDGRHLAFVAYATEGLKIVDLSNPAAPRELGTWIPEGPDAPTYTHTVTVRMFGDRRIAAVGAETFENRNRDLASPVWLLDVTDLAQPQALARWTNPGDVGSNDLLFSAHDMRFDEQCPEPVAPNVDTTACRVLLWLAHYHAGVWALDVTDPSAPRVAGMYLPHEDQGFVPPDDCCSGLRMSGRPLAFDVVARDGVAYAADMWSGLYTLRLDE